MCEEEYGYGHGHGFGNGHGGFGGGFGFDGGLIGKRSDTVEDSMSRRSDAGEDDSTKSNLVEHQPADQ